MKSILINFFVILCFISFVSCSQDPKEELPLPVQVPENVRLLSSTETSLIFMWDAVEGAVKYGARLETSDGTLVGSVTYPQVNQSVYRDLETGKEYRFMVRAITENDQSDYSDPVTAVPESAGEGENPPAPLPSGDYEKMMIPAHEDTHAKALAFPGAEGGGMYTRGGRGGKVIHVTNLNDSGEGSLRAAVNEKGPRIIVFDVAGVIELESTLQIKNGDVTIAGQTAPGDGICIKNYTTQIAADNVVIRFVHFRLGDESRSDGADAVWGRYHSDIIIDHCSMSWCIDECASFYANCNFTLQWSILTESLRVSVHDKGNHGYGGIWGGKNASFHHNMLANHDSRNPRFDHPQIYVQSNADYRQTHRGAVDYRNNVVYNWGSNSSYGGENGWFNMVNNYYKPGPASKDRKYFIEAYADYSKGGVVYADSYPQLYMSGNVHTAHNDITTANTKGVKWSDGTSPSNYNVFPSTPHKLTGPASENIYTTTHSAQIAFERVCEYAGASLVRDAVDQRACSDAKAGTATFMDGGNGSTGGLIDTPAAVGGWPEYKATAQEMEKIKDTDRDGIPDWFEDEFGLSKSDPSDGAMITLDIYGRYTNVEMYLHYIVRELVKSQIETGEYSLLS